MVKLTPKQEKFVHNMIKGMSQRQAYKDAFKSKYSEKAIDEKACVLFNSEKVQKRYRELLDKIDKKAIMSAKERQEWLTNVIKDENTDINAKLKAIDIFNKMTAEYVTKIDGSMSVKKLEDIL